jgi:hypothetical protein
MNQKEYEKVKWVYLGEGKYFVGIPKRNLSQKDIDKFAIDEKFLEKSGIYQRFEEPVKVTKKKKEGE